jgi:hypothetical protein
MNKGLRATDVFVSKLQSECCFGEKLVTSLRPITDPSGVSVSKQSD